MNMRTHLGSLAWLLTGVSILGCGNDDGPNPGTGDSAATGSGAETAPDTEANPGGDESNTSGDTETGDTETGNTETGDTETGTDSTGTDDTENGRAFPCGELECDAATQYCQVYVAGQRGQPNSYQCLDVPGECGQATDCACLDEVADIVNVCDCSEEGGLTVTCVTP